MRVAGLPCDAPQVRSEPCAKMSGRSKRWPGGTLRRKSKFQNLIIQFPISDLLLAAFCLSRFLFQF